LKALSAVHSIGAVHPPLAEALSSRLRSRDDQVRRARPPADETLVPRPKLTGVYRAREARFAFFVGAPCSPKEVPEEGGRPSVHVGAALDQHDEVVLSHQTPRGGRED
jgi:hypothetical protein